MTTMTNEAADKIADQTLKKYEAANRDAFMVLLDNEDTSMCVKRTNGLKESVLADVCVNILMELLRENFVREMKNVIKEYKKGVKNGRIKY